MLNRKKSDTKGEINRDIDAAAKTGYWDKVPLDEKTWADLLSIQPDGNAPIHTAVLYNKLHKVPKELLNENSLRCQTSSKQSVFHLAASNNQLNAIPKRFLTKENLTTKDREGNTPLHCAAYGLCLRLIDIAQLDAESLLEENNYDKSPLDMFIYAVDQYQVDKTQKQQHLLLLEHFLNLLDLKQLQILHRKMGHKKKEIKSSIAKTIIKRDLKDLNSKNVCL